MAFDFYLTFNEYPLENKKLTNISTKQELQTSNNYYEIMPFVLFSFFYISKLMNICPFYFAILCKWCTVIKLANKNKQKTKMYSNYLGPLHLVYHTITRYSTITW